MLLGIQTCISPELLYTLARMGHGDELVLVNAYFPSYSHNANVIQCRSRNVAELLDGIFELINPDSFVEHPITMMEPANGDVLDPQIEADYRAVVDRHWPETPTITRMERQAFLVRSTAAFCIVQTGEVRKYGNIILKKGVIPL